LLNPVMMSPREQDKPAKPAARSCRPVEEVLVINVVAREADGFKGPGAAAEHS
jgi:cell division protein ZipA